MVHFPFTPELQALHVRLPEGHSGRAMSDFTNLLFRVFLLVQATLMSIPDFLVMLFIFAHKVSSMYGRDR